MASIPMTQKLLAAIKRAADQRTEPGITRARANKIDPSWAEFVYNTIIPRETVTLLHTLPKGWVRYTKTFAINAIEKQGDRAVTEKTFGYTMDLPEERPWPYDVSPSTVNHLDGRPLARNRYRGDPTSIVLCANPVWDELYDRVEKHHAAIDAASRLQRNYRNYIQRICEQHSTLRLALQDFPPLWELLTSPVRAQTTKPTDPTGKRNTPDVDYDFLVSTTAATKIW